MNLIIKRVLLFSVFILPFIVFTGLYYPTVFSKSIFLQGLSLTLGALWFGSLLFKKKEENKISKNIIFFSFGIYIFIALISCLHSVVPGLSFWGSMDRGVGTIFLLLIFLLALVISSIFKNKEDWYKLFTTISLSGIFFTIGTHLALSGISLYPKIKLDIISGFTLGNSSYAGIYLAFVFFIGLGVLCSSSLRSQKIAGALGMLSVVLNPIITGFIMPGGQLVGAARTTFYSIAIGIIIFLLYVLFRKISSALWKKIFIGALGVIILAGVVFVFTQKPNPIRQFVADNAGPNRLVFWNIAMKGFQEKPILGWGNDTYQLVYTKYFDPIVTTPGYLKEFWVDRSHNIVFDEMVSSGILGLLSLILFFGAMLYGFIRKAILEKEKEGFLHMALFVGIVAFLIQEMMIFQVVIGWFLIAVVVAFCANFCFNDRPIFKNKIDWPKYKRVILPILILGYIVLFVFVIIKPISMSYALANLKEMNIEDRIDTYQKIKKFYVGNTTDLGSLFLPFSAEIEESLKKHQGQLSSEQKKMIAKEMEEIISVLEIGLKKERYLDMKLLMSSVSYYTILTQLTDGNEKEDYYEKGMMYIEKMKQASPENPITDISEDVLNTALNSSF